MAVNDIDIERVGVRGDVQCRRNVEDMRRPLHRDTQKAEFQRRLESAERLVGTVAAGSGIRHKTDRVPASRSARASGR